MKAEFFLDFCFIRGMDEQKDDFLENIEEQMVQLFGGKATWYLEGKQEEQVEIVLVEVKGHGEWEKQDDVVEYIEEHASDSFLEWLQGYRMTFDVKEKHEGCANCGQNETKAATGVS